MSNQWLIIVAVGEKGVQYGNNHNYSQQIIELYATNGIPLGLTQRGAVIYFLQSRNTFKQIEQFFERAELLRQTLPLLNIGLAREILHRKFDWFGLAKPRVEIDYALENLALERIRGSQNYRRTLEYMEAESGFGPMLEAWR
jgi:hypothetical protein